MKLAEMHMKWSVISTDNVDPDIFSALFYFLGVAFILKLVNLGLDKGGGREG